jgi:hypothetical protein
MAGSLRCRPIGRRLDVRRRRSPVYCHWRGGAGIFRRNGTSRSAGPLDSPAAGADDCRRQLAVAPVDLAVAGCDRPSPAGRLDRRNGSAADRNPAAMDPVRRRISEQLDVRYHSRSPQTDDRRRSGRRRHRFRRPFGERAIRPQPADPARRLRSRADHRLRECRESAVGPRRRAPDSNGRAAGDRRNRPADRGGSAHGKPCCSRSREDLPGC